MKRLNKVELIGRTQFVRPFVSNGNMQISFVLKVPNQKEDSKRDYEFKCVIWGFLADRTQTWLVDNKYVQISGILKEDARRDKETGEWKRMIGIEVKTIKDVTYECLGNENQNQSVQQNAIDPYAQVFGRDDQIAEEDELIETTYTEKDLPF